MCLCQVLTAGCLWLTLRDASVPPATWLAAADTTRAAAFGAAIAQAVRARKAEGREATYRCVVHTRTRSGSVSNCQVGGRTAVLP